MGEILKIEAGTVYIGMEGGKLVRASLSALNFENPQVGDQVNVYQDETTMVVSLDQPEAVYVQQASKSKPYGSKSYNKHVFAWVFAGLLGWLGVDRFARGQIFLGILKLLTGGGFFFWWAFDAIEAFRQAYICFSDEDDVVFVDGRYILYP